MAPKRRSEGTGWPGQIPWRYSVAELWADGVVHVMGIVLAITGSLALLVSRAGAPLPEIAAVATYLGTLVLSIGVSAAYNIWPVSRIKWWLRRLDHSAIFLLIAGTYTPFMAKVGTWWLLGGVWMVAGFGIALKVFWPGRHDRLSIGLYLAMGWSGIVVVHRVTETLSPLVLGLIAAGGLVYTAGIVFHLWERLRFQNAIWHGFVLAAATMHFAAVWAAVEAV